MDFLKSLSALGLNPDNSVVIGSGILSALEIRKSKDIDVVVDDENYARLSKDTHFKKTQNHGQEILADELFEIGTYWGVLDKNQTFDDLLKQSQVVNGVRYITLEFLFAVKESWLLDDDVRQKDIDDVKLIKNYLTK